MVLFVGCGLWAVGGSGGTASGGSANSSSTAGRGNSAAKSEQIVFLQGVIHLMTPAL
jgi:hypothetical protein